MRYDRRRKATWARGVLLLIVGAGALNGCGEQDLYEPPQSPIRVIGRLALPSVVEDVDALGSHAYLAGGQAGLYVADLRDPAAPAMVSITRPTKYGYAIRAVGTPSHGSVVNIAFLVEGTEGITSYNISDPANVTSLEQGSDARDAENMVIEMSGDPEKPYVVYVADSYHGILVFESDPIAPGIFTNRIQAYTRGVAKAVDAADGFVYVADDEMGVAVVDARVRIIHLVKLVSYADTPGNARDLIVKDGYVYVADGLNGLEVMEIQIGDDGIPAPVPAAHLALAGYCRSIAARGNRVYLAAQDGGVHVVDVSDPRNPRLAGTIVTTYAMGVAVMESGIVLAADKAEGLIVMGGEVPSVLDTTPPAKIVDLSAEPVGSSSMRLTWHATGNDHYAGIASQYDVRFARAPITPETWEAAEKASDEPLPSRAGTPETCVVAGLEKETGYYFALKSGDASSNWSMLSNVVSDTTLGGTAITNGSVAPRAGTPSTSFTFRVTYFDGDGDVPTVSDVLIDGERHAMALVGGDPAEAALYEFTTTLPKGVHSYSFEFNDGHGNTATLDAVQGPWVGDEVLVMGSPLGEMGRDPDELQRTVVFSRGVQIEDHEVTQLEYRTTMGTNPSRWVGDSRPVENVTWYDAVRYCNERSIDESLEPAYEINGETVTWNPEADGYRLPTEAEWERACRAGSSTAFATGGISFEYCELDAVLDALGWYCGNAGAGTHDVKTKQANAWGLYDMHGNVWEWCWDWYEETPAEVSFDGGPPSGMQRVIRGGSWYYYARDCRSASRGVYWPNSRDDVVGFRVARTAP